MPRYFFNVYDGIDILDEIGTELPSLADVRKQSVRYAGELLQEGNKTDLWTGKEWRMVVSDEGGAEVLILRFTAAETRAAA